MIRGRAGHVGRQARPRSGRGRDARVRDARVRRQARCRRARGSLARTGRQARRHPARAGVRGRHGRLRERLGVVRAVSHEEVQQPHHGRARGREQHAVREGEAGADGQAGQSRGGAHEECPRK
ncbi:hypothetical protein DN051_42075 (plasmid) [Streptomyces cadmiisoli]|uniref:Uncharacterized protein n=1 Tax=Streptomyces cadmiisoli TaxID=2184053 RepID=A0A2Z4JF41_9ACTN|nr:hypothetical protein DN051_42075 [Streptomyces cadmiisoli]